MTASARTRLSVLPVRSDRLALTVLLLAAGGLLAWRAAGTTGTAGDGLPVDRSRSALVDERIDPNTASAASLRRLPRIGPGKARAIVEYRTKMLQRGRLRAFEVADDLTKVPGIGPGTVRLVAGHLAISRGPSNTPR